jgi:uncharacterized protein (TIGR03437 family)
MNPQNSRIPVSRLLRGDFSMSARHILSIGAILAVAACFPAPAQAQTLTASRNQLYFVYQRTAPGASSLTQQVDITSNVNVPISGAATTLSGGDWLLIGLNNSSTPATLLVLVNPSVTPPLAPASYTGTITITPQTGTPLSIGVTLVVSDSPLMQPGTNLLTFRMTRGGTLPTGQALALSSTSGSISYIASALTSSGGDWLRLDPATGAIPASGTSNIGVSIANAASLPIGTYTGTIVVTAPGAGNSGLQIQVILQIVEEARINAGPASITFEHQIGSPSPGERLMFVSSPSGAIPFRAEAINDTGGTWLGVPGSNATFTTPGFVQVTATPGALPAGTYTGRVRITSTAASNSPVDIPVSLRIGGDPVLTASVDSLRFSFQTGGGPAPRQALVVNSTTSGTPLIVDAIVAAGSPNWLNVIPSRPNAPAAISVGVDSAGLTAGTHNGSVRISGSAAGTTPIVIPVTYVVAAAPLVRLSESFVTIVAQQGGNAPEARVVAVSSTGAPISLSVSAISNTNWLTAQLSTNTTPANLTLSVNATGLPTGTYSGAVTIGPTDGSTPAVTLPVRMQVTNAPSLFLSPTALVFSYAVGSGQLPANQSFRVASTSGAVNYNLTGTTADGAPWLVLSRTQGTTGGTDTVVAVNPTSLSAGVYSGLISVTGSAPNSPQFLPILLVVSGQSQDFSVSPTSLTFNQTSGAQAPSSQTLSVRLAPDGRIAFTVATALVNGTGWLTVTPSEGITPTDLTVSVTGTNLPAGAYTGTITLTPLNAPNLRTIVIPVTFNVVRLLPNLTIARDTAAFNYTVGGPNAQLQTIALASSGDPLAFTVTTQPQNSWLQASPPLGNTPQNLNISVNPSGLSPGTYTGTVIISSAGAANSPRIVNVTLAVSQPALPAIAEIIHSATLQPTAAAPGLIVAVKVSNMGNIPPTNGRITPAGNLDTTLANVRVLFDGIPGPITFIGPSLNLIQVNCVVPYAVAGRASTRVTVDNNGAVSQPVDLRVVDAIPGIYQLNDAGQAAAVNENNTINGANTAAPRNSIIAFYATGEGATSPPGIDGFIPQTANQVRRPLLPVRVRIAGLDSEVVYAASAAGFVSGAFLVYAVVPANSPTGPQIPVEILVGSFSSGPGRTIAVR